MDSTTSINVGDGNLCQHGPCSKSTADNTCVGQSCAVTGDASLLRENDLRLLVYRYVTRWEYSTVINGILEP